MRSAHSSSLRSALPASAASPGRSMCTVRVTPARSYCSSTAGSRGGIWMRHRDLAAPGLGSEPLQLLDPGDHLVVGRDPVGEPGVAEGQHPLQHVRPVAADQHRRMRVLQRRRAADDPIEVHELAVVGGLLVGPDLLAGLDPLAQDLEALLRDRCRGSASPRGSSRPRLRTASARPRAGPPRRPPSRW